VLAAVESKECVRMRGERASIKQVFGACKATAAQWRARLARKKKQVLPPFPIIRRFDFSRYNVFTVHLDIVYI
jgi:hypothetical protein